MKLSRRQQGVATLMVTVILLVALTIILLFSARVGIFDQRMSGNEARYKEAFAIAEAGLDFSSQHFARQFHGLSDATSSAQWVTIIANTNGLGARVPNGSTSTSTSTPPYFLATITNSGTSFGGIPIFSVSSTGRGADGTGTATIQRQFTFAHAFGGKIPDVPIIVAGAVGTGGNFNVVANPNSGGPGIPVSIWSNDTITTSAGSATCHMQFYDGNNAQCSNPSGSVENITFGQNPATALTAHDGDFPDLLPNDPNFPTDLFNFMFGVPRADWAVKKAEAASYGQVVDSCAPVVAAGTDAGKTFPLWWVTGDCAISGGPVLGSIADPIILVVDDHELRITGGAQINGIVYLFDNPDDAATPEAALGGTTEIIGSFVSDMGGSAMSGSYAVVYNPDVVESFLKGGNNYTFSYVPGSWRDF